VHCSQPSSTLANGGATCGSMHSMAVYYGLSEQWVEDNPELPQAAACCISEAAAVWDLYCEACQV
jgi:hypothetical protein